jgi:uncharacterized protein YecT (DUF1311 family)
MPRSRRLLIVLRPACRRRRHIRSNFFLTSRNSPPPQRNGARFEQKIERSSLLIRGKGEHNAEPEAIYTFQLTSYRLMGTISMEKIRSRSGLFRMWPLAVAILCVACSTLTNFAVPAVAEAKQEALPCSSETTTAGMRNCENLRFQRAEQALDSVYAELMKKVDKTGQAKLRAAQSAWLQFRQAEADFQADMVRGGTLAPLIKITVMADLTEGRVEQLRKELQP